MIGNGFDRHIEFSDQEPGMRFWHQLYLLIVVLFVPESPALAQHTGPPSQNDLIQRLGYPSNARLLIIHADDFGMMHSVDSAIMEAFEKSWITSASILVPCPWFPEVAQWAKLHPKADLGVHLALNSEWNSYRWPPVSAQPGDSGLRDPDGYLPTDPEYVIAHARMSDVEMEVHGQIDKAKAAGIPISHLDDHMDTIVSSEGLLNVYLRAARLYGIPATVSKHFSLYGIRLESDAIVLDDVLEIGPGVSRSHWLDAYENMLRPLPPGVYELIVHLARNDSEMQGATFDHPDWGAQWRQNDFDLVSSPEFERFLKEQKFILISWRDLGKLLPANRPHPSTL
jgi:predicted glycoside hydrolase/deacetylase ChbG (UPF0249 family)